MCIICLFCLQLHSEASIFLLRNISSVLPPRGTWLRTYYGWIEWEEKKPSDRSHDLKSFAPRACALPLCYNPCPLWAYIMCCSSWRNPLGTSWNSRSLSPIEERVSGTFGNTNKNRTMLSLQPSRTSADICPADSRRPYRFFNQRLKQQHRRKKSFGRKALILFFEIIRVWIFFSRQSLNK